MGAGILLPLGELWLSSSDKALNHRGYRMHHLCVDLLLLCALDRAYHRHCNIDMGDIHIIPGCLQLPCWCAVIFEPISGNISLTLIIDMG
jgi:hypothetical protein